jgi:ribonuclease D
VLVDTIGIEHRNLDFVLKQYLGVSIDKKKKFQKHDWTARPIDNNALEYALSDVAYLFELKDVLVKKISDNDLIEEALYNMAKSSNVKSKSIQPKIFRSKEYKDLSNIEQRRFSKIHCMCDEIANDLNIPPANIMNNQLMLELSKTIDNISVSIFYKNIQRTIATELILKIKVIWEETV